MTQLNWTKEADQWLRDIHAYIMKDNPVAAGQVISGIYDKAQLLMSFPEIGYRYRETPEGEVRVLLYGHYRIAYLYRKADARIDILGVFRENPGCTMPLDDAWHRCISREMIHKRTNL